MAKYKLTYFDFPGGRGEDCRLALHIAGADFEDDRVKGPTWRDRKASTPFGAMPVLTVDGVGELGQSNAILVYLGGQLEMHPTEPFQAARHLAVMGAVEDMRRTLQGLPTKDESEKKAKREEVASGYMQTWGANVQRQIGEGPFLAGKALCVADLKLFVLMRWFATGGFDHVPRDVFAGFPKLIALYEAVEAHPKVAAWYE
jgi:glutathione S-transferase